VAALASPVELLLLDEPTAGLDPLMEATFREVVRAERDAGRTVLLSSHILAEAEALSDRVTLIRDGRVVESGTLAELRHLRRTAVVARTREPIADLAGMAGAHDAVVDEDGHGLRGDVDHDLGRWSPRSAARVLTLTIIRPR
jgi:ABC-2 type transport system ATP-binding protein